MLNVDHGNPVTFKVDHDIDKKIFSTYVNDKILDMFNLAKTIKPIQTFMKYWPLEITSIYQSFTINLLME